MTVTRVGEYQIDDDRSHLDYETLWHFFSAGADWGRWRTRAVLEEQIENSWQVIAAYDGQRRLVGFARAISDGHGVAYLADVYVDEPVRGRGIGRALVSYLLERGPEFRWMLHTRDAGDFYARLGFGPADNTYMERSSPVAMAPGRVRPRV